MSSHELTVARLQEQTEALGPGRRAVIWFHGCTLSCPGCIATEMNRSHESTRYPPERLAAWLSDCEGIEGVTLSGGDPMDQPLAALAHFASLVKRDRRNLSIMCYTGRTIEQVRNLQAKSGVNFLDHLDILIDGQYVDALNDGSMWRGSSNQQVHFLSSRYAKFRSLMPIAKGNSVEVEVDAQLRLKVTGIPPVGFMNELKNTLHDNGFGMNFNRNENCTGESA